MNLLQSIHTALPQGATATGIQREEAKPGEGGAFPAILAVLGGQAVEPAEGGAVEGLQALLTSLLEDAGPVDDPKGTDLLRQLAERIEGGRSLDDLLQDPGVQAQLAALLPPEALDLLQQWQAAVGGNPLPGPGQATAESANTPGEGRQAAVSPGPTPVVMVTDRSGAPGSKAALQASDPLPSGAMAWSRPAPGDAISTQVQGPISEGVQAMPKESPAAGMRELAALFGSGPVAPQTQAPQGLAAAMPPLQPAPAPSTAATPAPGPITLPPGHRDWGPALGDRVVWMLRNEVQTAEVKITPAHLGPVEIRLSLHHDQASVAFQAPHAATREALEAAAPRVRELLADAGLGQVNVDVGQGGAGQERPQAEGLAPHGSWDDASEGDLPAARVAVTELRGASGLVDDFA